MEIKEAIAQLKSIRAYGECYNGTIKVGEIVDLIEWQQAEIEKYKRRNGEKLVKIDELQVKIFDLEKENAEIRKQVDEAKAENESYGKTINEASETIRKKNDRIVELQKQVDDSARLLSERQNELWDLIESGEKVIECHGLLKGCDMVKQAVKDTVKEIYRELCGHGTTYVKMWIKKRYGVEVE